MLQNDRYIPAAQCRPAHDTTLHYAVTAHVTQVTAPTL
jgi:hypothetical protein